MLRRHQWKTLDFELRQDSRAVAGDCLGAGNNGSATDRRQGMETAMTKLEMKRLVIALGGALVASAFAAGSASAYFVEIDTFTVTRNGTDILVDDFADNTPPPSTPVGSPTTYGTNGTFAEAGTVATMTTATGAPNVFGGTNFIRHSATLLTNIQPGNAAGLRSNLTLAVEGLFDVNIPTNNRESYGVYFTDNMGGMTGDDQLEIRLVRNQAGQVGIQFQRVDYVAQMATGIESIGLLAAVGAPALADTANDQLLLRLDRPSIGSNLITASYEYFDNGTSLGLVSFANMASIFNGEDWTRAGFFARVARAVPEPGTLTLFAFGLAGLGFIRRRKRAADS
jgi:hypothetical protein